MPDPKQMSGIPRPVDDLPDATVSVRLIRGQLSNNITGHDVQLLANGKPVTVKTERGRPRRIQRNCTGTTVKAIDRCRRRASRVAGISVSCKGWHPPDARRDGQCGRGEAGSDRRCPHRRPVADRDAADRRDVAAFLSLDDSNAQSVPVNPATPFVFDMPSGSTGTSVLEGSSPLAVANGGHVTVSGPFPPGQTFVQVACELPVDSGTMEIVAAVSLDSRRAGGRRQENRRHEVGVAANQGAAGHGGRRRGLHRGNRSSGSGRAAGYVNGQRATAP